MSLTSHLRSGPLKDWFVERLGRAGDVVNAVNATLSEGGTPIARGCRDPQVVGHAVDLMIRASLRSDALDRPIGPSMPTAALSLAASQVERQAANAITSLELGSPSTVDWERAARIGLVLAWLERTRRAPFARAVVAERVKGRTATLEEWEDALADPLDLDDLTALAPAAIADHADLRAARDVVLGPTFSHSRALGGADADMIADGLLLDFKSTADARVVRKEDLWQVIGYALADAGDTYRIRRVGISAVRWRRRWTRPLDALVVALGGGDLAGVRREFREVVTRLPLRRRRADDRG
jgi:hypothetical protein